ncbi:hypothetical protein AM571_CH02303 [Rhizobium etli 8C-3]|uniref:Uncharacterized protein n=1 Tax=Rhizobium etli 8C-3 TaxID=538025 RepID=A0A1L5P4P4_RHIET|nr:hypothetical protein [Rhizobium etli]APO75112.1 hypothetical protein AM571_CH02303 [Rhizobium etli 8C-3]
MAQGLAITRGQLAMMRGKAADAVKDQNDKEALAEVIRLHIAIQAIDAVLVERGAGNQESPWNDPTFRLNR